MTDASMRKQPPGRAKSKRVRALYERSVFTSLFGCASFSILTTFAIIIVLFQQTAGFFGLHGDDTPGALNSAEKAVETPPTTRLSEIRIAEESGLNVRYVEIAGPPGESLDGVTHVVIRHGAERGDSGVISTAIDLTGKTLGPRGHLLLADRDKIFGVAADIVADYRFDDSGPSTHLLVRGFSGQPGLDLDPDDDGVLDAEPWTERIDALALVDSADRSRSERASHWYSETTVGPRAQLYVPEHVVRDPESGEWELGASDATYVSLGEFVTGTEWNPLLGAEKHFGIWALVSGTLLVAGVAMLIAIPFGLITAIFLSEYAPRRLRAVLKPTLEILAGIPTVVYGFFALTVITPTLRGGALWFTGLFSDDPEPVFGIYNAFSAGVAVGIMCLPIVSSLSEDALQAVPRSLREGAHAVGGTRFDVSVKVVVPAALSGVMAAFLLAIARAVGETMIVALAAGNAARFSFDPTQETQTMTAYMVQIFLGDASNFGPEYLSAYAVGATLFVMTFILTVIGARVLKRYREAYE